MSSERPQNSDQQRRGADASGGKQSNRRPVADLPGAHASRPSWQVTESGQQLAALPDADRQLFWLASEVNSCAESARSLALGEIRGPAVYLDAAKRVEDRRMRRMLLAWFGFREELGATYRDARMLLTTYILGPAGILRHLRTGASRLDPAHESLILRDGAERASFLVAFLYPTLAAPMGEADRKEKIRAAIESASTTDKRTPWPQIAATWAGIEKVEPDPERWRKDWYEHQHSLRP